MLSPASGERTTCIVESRYFSLPGDVTASKRYWAQDIIEPEVEVGATDRIVQRMDSGIGYRVREDLWNSSPFDQAGIHGMIVYESGLGMSISSPSFQMALSASRTVASRKLDGGRRRRFASRPL